MLCGPCTRAEGSDVSTDGDTADLIFVNGAVYTVDAARRWAQAVAVRDGRIVAVGTDAEIRALAGSGTDVVDLAGGMLVPGFQDSHVHPVGGGIDMLQCDLHRSRLRRGVPGGHQGLRRGQPGCPLDPRRRLGDGRVPRRHPHEGGPRRCGGRPTRVPPQSGRARGLGQLRGVEDGRRHAGHGGSRGRAHRAERAGGAVRDPARGSDGSGGQPRAASVDRGIVCRTAEGAGLPALAGDHRRGRTRSWGPRRGWTTSMRTSGPRGIGDLTARVVGALWWDRHRGLEQVDDLLRTTGTRARRPVRAPPA